MMHVNQVRLTGKTGSVQWENQPSEWKGEEVENNGLENLIGRIQAYGRMYAPEGASQEQLSQMLMTKQGYLKNGAAVFFEESNLCELQMVVCEDDARHNITESQRVYGSLLKVIQIGEQYIMERTEGYPASAVHELLINAFCHRNFDSTQCNQIVIFENHIEIFNPGIFPEGYAADDFCSRGQRPVPMNPLIARTLYYLGYMNGLGLGLKNVKDVCDNAGIRMKLQRDKGGVVAVLSGGRLCSVPKDKFGEDLTANERMILEYLCQHAWVSNASAREIVHMGTTATRNLLNGLVDKGFLIAEGENRGRKYCLTDIPF